jgi:D-alanine-D-alanine ligase
MTLRVLHLVGSVESDFMCELSCLYARDCLEAIRDPIRYEPHVVYVTPDGRWRFTAGLDPAAIAAAQPLTLAQAVASILSLSPDVMVPQMFCLAGMTRYRALFDLLGIPFVGNAPETMALAADKVRARAVVAASGVAIPEGEVVAAGGRPTLAPPAVVKPVSADNSEGVTLVRRSSEFDRAIAVACEVSAGALVERYVELGREVRCATIVRDGALECLPLEEYAVDPRHKPIRDQADKLRRDEAGRLSLVAKEPTHAWIVDRDDPVCAPVWDAALRCHRALGCRHYGLFDFRIDPSGRPWFLEAGLYCSFARSSVVATMAAAAGLGVDQLFAIALETALGSALPRELGVA